MARLYLSKDACMVNALRVANFGGVLRLDGVRQEGRDALAELKQATIILWFHVSEYYINHTPRSFNRHTALFLAI